jgi:hypothetical protein
LINLIVITHTWILFIIYIVIVQLSVIYTCSLCYIKTTIKVCLYCYNITLFVRREVNVVWFMVLDATFNNISVISWRSVLLVEETRGPRENHWPVASHWQTITWCCIKYTLPWTGFELTTFSGDRHWLHR